MEWIQTITLGVTLIAYMTGVCVFFYHLNEKNINKTEDRLERNETNFGLTHGDHRDPFSPSFLYTTIDIKKLLFNILPSILLIM